MHQIAKYHVLQCLFDLFMTDGQILRGVYLAKTPGDSRYRIALQILPGSVKVFDIADDEILAAVDPKKVTFEC